MGNRCPDCNHFVSVECEAELNEFEFDPEGQTVKASVRLTLLCAECGTELAEAEAEAEDTFDHFHEENPENPEDEEWEWDAEENLELEDDCPEPEMEDRSVGKGRYAKHFWGAKIEYSIHCKTCDETIEGELLCEEQASYFDQLY